MSDDGWNLVGNPYPCPIDWDASGWTKNNIDNAMYFYEPTGSDGSYKYYYYINTGVGSISNPASVTSIIAPEQGFFVHATNPGNGTLACDNSVRVDNNSIVYYKKSSNNIQLLRVKAIKNNSPNMSDEAVIYFNEQASAKFDKNNDALKIIGSNANELNVYTLSDDRAKLSINALPPLNNQTVSVPLEIKANDNGEYSISISEMTNISSQAKVYLVDMVLGKTQEMEVNSVYSFKNIPEKAEGRFFIEFNPKSSTNVENPEGNVILYSYTSGENLNVLYSNTSNDPGTLDIFNTVGQKVINTTKVNNGNYRFSLSNGSYIIRLVTNNKTYSKKVIIE